MQLVALKFSYWANNCNVLVFWRVISSYGEKFDLTVMESSLRLKSRKKLKRDKKFQKVLQMHLEYDSKWNMIMLLHVIGIPNSYCISKYQSGFTESFVTDGKCFTW